MREDIISFLEDDNEYHPFYLQMTGISYCDGSYKIYRKNSSICCFEYIIKGRGTVNINGKTFTPVEGDIYFLPRGCDQLYYSDDKDPWVKIWFNISGPLVDHLMKVYKLNDIYHIKNFDLKKQFYKMLSIAQSPNEKTKDVFSKAALLFHEIVLKIFSRIQVEKPIHSPTALKLKHYLDEHIENNISIKELGDYIHLSPSQTTRIFKNAFGITPYNYLLRKKIDTAKLMLLYTNMPVKEIALKLSFADEHYFSNYFKSKVGISPMKFKNSI